jgi:hypothetical protein
MVVAVGVVAGKSAACVGPAVAKWVGAGVGLAVATGPGGAATVKMGVITGGVAGERVAGARGAPVSAG